MVFHCSFSDSKSFQNSKTPLSILADPGNVVVWMASTCPLISKFSSPFNNLSITVPRAPITIGINATFMFLSLFNSKARSRYLSFFSLSFNFTQWSAGMAKSTILQVFCCCCSCCCYFWLKLGDPFVCQSLSVSFSMTDAGLSIYHLFAWPNLDFLHNSQWITLPMKSFLSYTLSVQISCIRLLCDLWFRLSHLVTYICYFVSSYLFLL